eukprot:m.241789 g.241789  ORF g.241789 m.241789 type:complete len:81 (+) comp24783_c0_seq1:127-369(+)
MLSSSRFTKANSPVALRRSSSKVIAESLATPYSPSPFMLPSAQATRANAVPFRDGQGSTASLGVRSAPLVPASPKHVNRF